MTSTVPSKSQKDMVREHFGAAARAWQSVYAAEDLASLLIQRRGQKVLEYVDSLGLARGARVLDLGCGAGLMSRQLIQRGWNVVGVDVAESMVELARTNCASLAAPGQAVFQVGDAEGLDFAEGSFDVVIAMGLIEYLEWDRWALQQIHRVIRTGGHLIVTVPNLLRLSHIVDPWYLAVQTKKGAGKMLRKLLRTSSPPQVTYLDRYYRIGRLRTMLERLGYQVEDAYSHGYGPFWSFQRFGRFSVWLDGFFQNLRRLRLAPFLARMGSDYILLCKATPSIFGVDDRRGFPDPEQNRRRLESERRPLVHIRNAWLAANPQHRSPRAESLATQDCAGMRVLVLAPHPDDEIIGCGGTLLRLMRGGARVTVIHATNGSGSAALAKLPPAVRESIRLDHARAVGAAAGFHELVFWNEPDGLDPSSSRRVEDLAGTIQNLRPNLVFVPFVTDIHRDHVALNAILLRALERVTDPPLEARILGYEVWSLAPHNLYCEISEVMKLKEELLLMYRTEMMVDDYVHSCEALHFYNSRRLTGKNGFVEGFFALDCAAYQEMARRNLRMEGR